MRAFVAVGLALILAGCLEDEPVPEPAAEPDDACRARGLVGSSCRSYCDLHAAVCGLPLPTPAPYPALPAPPAAIPTLPPGSALSLGSPPPVGSPSIPAPGAPTTPAPCALVPCPQL